MVGDGNERHSSFSVTRPCRPKRMWYNSIMSKLSWQTKGIIWLREHKGTPEGEVIRQKKIESLKLAWEKRRQNCSITCPECGKVVVPIKLPARKCHRCGHLFANVKKPKILSEWDRAWLSAAVDFEGTLTIYKERTNCKRGFTYSPLFTISTINRDSIEKVKDILGTGYITIIKQTNDKWNDLYRYNCHSNTIRMFLPQIVDNLIIKKDVARLVLQGLDILSSFNPDKDDKMNKIKPIWEQIVILNKRGK